MSSIDKLFLSLTLVIIGVLLCYVDLLKFYDEHFVNHSGGGFGNHLLLDLFIGMILAISNIFCTLPFLIYPHILYYKSNSSALLVIYVIAILGIFYALYLFYQVIPNPSAVIEFEKFKIWLSFITVVTITFYRFRKNWKLKGNA